ncbi:Ig kappa chain V-III region CLL [Acipenser ruthenus]|uniref:Ig kappa chain V-III region CLL n=1 Tax=Acipenser ruthenus TaxID=7906 RepID=A0A444US24_ACIRT|nr:Ig kappa chain V-III region CLL [Acipenser ruthenus]
MAGVFIVFTALLLCLPDLNGIKIDQSPPSLFESPGRSAELNCSHDDSNYDKMYWYQQTRKGVLELIAYQYGTTTHEEKFKARFKMTGKATEKGFLTISNLRAEDSAVYFCAASIHSAADHLSPLQ